MSRRLATSARSAEDVDCGWHGVVMGVDGGCMRCGSGSVATAHSRFSTPDPVFITEHHRAADRRAYAVDDDGDAAGF